MGAISKNIENADIDFYGYDYYLNTKLGRLLISLNKESTMYFIFTIFDNVKKARKTNFLKNKHFGKNGTNWLNNAIDEFKATIEPILYKSKLPITDYKELKKTVGNSYDSNDNKLIICNTLIKYPLVCIEHSKHWDFKSKNGIVVLIDGVAYLIDSKTSFQLWCKNIIK